MTCSEVFFDSEISFIPKTLCDNGYPPNVINCVIRDKITASYYGKIFGVFKTSVKGSK